MWASYSGQIELVNVLIELGADIEAVDKVRNIFGNAIQVNFENISAIICNA